jgi:hypothetical protein
MAKWDAYQIFDEQTRSDDPLAFESAAPPREISFGLQFAF